LKNYEQTSREKIESNLDRKISSEPAIKKYNTIPSAKKIATIQKIYSKTERLENNISE